MEQPEIIKHLKQGWELANRGRGWWLSEPRIPYRKTQSIPVDEAVINAMVRAGIIKTELPYTTLFARLVPTPHQCP
jgi:hypothetical protein